MLTKHSYKNLTWVDVESPSNDEVKELMQEYDIHPFVAEELLKETLKPKLDVYDSYLYAVLHFPAPHQKNGGERSNEMNFIIGKNFLITIRYGSVDSLKKFSQEFEMDSVIEKDTTAKHGGYVFFYMVRSLYRALADDLERLEGVMVRIEDHIFSGKERQMVKALSDVSKALLDIKQAIHHHGDILTQLQKEGKKLFNETFARSLKEVEGDWRTVNYMIENQQEMLTELRETNNSLLSTKQNEVMKILTIMAFVTFPLSLLASIFGMNTDYLPLVGLPGDFWIIVAIMVILTGVFFAFFKYKKWL